MTHLTKAEPKGLFSATTPQRNSQETGDDHRVMIGPATEMMAPPFAVGVDMTPDQARKLRMANYPAYDWPSVENTGPRRRGKHY